MASSTTIIKFTLLDPAGNAQASAKVTATRLQDKATAVALASGGIGTADSFSATSNAQGLVTFTLVHRTQPAAPLTYRFDLPDNRYFIFPLVVADASQTIELGNVPMYDNPVPGGAVNITPLVLRNYADIGRGLTGGAVGSAEVTQVTYSRGYSFTTILTLDEFPVTLVKDGTTSGGGGSLLYTFPVGMVLPVGGSSNLTIAASGDKSFLASIGSAAADTGGTLTSTEITFLPSTAATTTSGAGTCKMKATVLAPVPGVWLDGTSTAAKMYLNACLNADATGVEDLLFSGTVVYRWEYGGDN